MNSSERAFDGRTPLLCLAVLVVAVAVGPAVAAGASSGGHLQAEGGSSGGTANDGLAESEPTRSPADEAPFVPSYGATETSTTFEVRDGGPSGGPLLEAGSNVDAVAERRDPGPVPDATMDATDDATIGATDPVTPLEPTAVDSEAPLEPAAVDSEAPLEPAAVDATDGETPADSRADGADDRQPGTVLGTLLEGMTVPVDPLAPANLQAFGLGSLFGGFVVAVVALRNLGSVSALAGSRRSDPSDAAGLVDVVPPGEATADATTTPPETGDQSADAGTGDAELAGTESDLIPDDCLVERILARNDGRLKQSAIVEATDWSKSKVSRLLTRMAEEGRIVKVSVGRENVIYLEGEEPGIVSEQPAGDSRRSRDGAGRR